jgi:hypothetical protein
MVDVILFAFHTLPRLTDCLGSHHPPATAYSIVNDKHGVEVSVS